MKKLLLVLFFATGVAFGQSSRPPISQFSQLQDVNVATALVGDTIVWNGTQWIPVSGTSIGLPAQVGQGGKFLITDGAALSWSTINFSSLGGKPTTAAGYGITGGANLDLWSGKTPYLGTLSVALGKTGTFSNTITLSGTDGAGLNVGSGGTLGSNAFSSAAFVLQTTSVNGHVLSGNVVVTKSDLSLGHILIGTGSPEGAVTAGIGSLFSRTDGGSGTSLYVKQSGSGNTGWTANTLGAGTTPTGGTTGQVLTKNSSTDYDFSWAAVSGGGGGGTVTSTSVTSANGVSASIATATTTPNFTFSLGAITPSSVAASGTVTGANLSGTNTGDQTITLTGAITGSGTGSFATSLTNGSVTLAKLANFPANTFLGNNTGGISAPVALTIPQTKSALSLDLVENTALSTWAGSGNVTTLGTIAAGNVPAGFVTGTNITGSVVSGTWPNLVVTADASVVQLGTDTDNVWTSASPYATNFIEGVPITANRSRTLPPTSGYVEGTVIKYLDTVTTGVFGPVFGPASVDTLKGQNAAAWTTAGGYKPFTAAGFGGGSKSITFQKKGTDWRVFAFGGENLSVSAFVNALDPNKRVPVDTSGQTPGANYSFIPTPLGNGVSIFPSVATGINWVKGVNTDGSLNVAAVDFNAIAPDQTGHDSEILHANATTGAYWSPDLGLLISPFVSVSPSGVVFTLLMDGTKIEQNHAISLAANSSLQFSGIQAGMHGTIEVTHTAGSTSLTLPTNSYTPNAQNGGTLGAVTLSTGAGAVDVLHWYYNQLTNKYLWDNPTLNVTAAAPTVPVPELLQWKLNEGTGTTITGTVNSINGTTSNAWTTATQTGTGAAQVLTSAGSATASSTINYGVPTITVTFWLYDAAYNATATAQPFISIGTAANSYRLYEASNKIIASLVGNATHSLVESIPVPSTSAWHFYAMVLDNSVTLGSIKIYLDNGGSQTLTLEGTNTHSGTGNFSSATFTVGGSNVSCNIDDIRIYNHELTSTEISSIYTANAQ